MQEAHPDYGRAVVDEKFGGNEFVAARLNEPDDAVADVETSQVDVADERPSERVATASLALNPPLEAAGGPVGKLVLSVVQEAVVI